jgi:HEAT repeat protein
MEDRDAVDLRRDSPTVQYKRAAAGMLTELAQAGFEVGSAQELEIGVRDGRWKGYRAAVPILLRWLARTEYLPLKQEILHQLQVKWAKRPEVARSLVEMFEAFHPRSSAEQSVKWTIGDTLTFVSDDRSFEDIARLARDKRHGRAREMLPLALAKMKEPGVTEVLIDLLEDEEVAGHTIIARGKLKATATRPLVEQFLMHPKTWVRTEAQRALRRIGSDAGREDRLWTKRKAAAPLLEELGVAGFPVEDVDDLRRGYKNYEAAVPVLLRWLPRVEHREVQYAVARALSRPFARPAAAPTLIAAFQGTVIRRPVDGYVKWWIGKAIGVVADKSVFEELVMLVRDKRHGPAREMLVVGLARTRGPRTIDVLIELLDDPDVAGQAVEALGRLRAVKALPAIQRLRDDLEACTRLRVSRVDAGLALWAIETGAGRAGGGLAAPTATG